MGKCLVESVEVAYQVEEKVACLVAVAYLEEVQIVEAYQELLKACQVAAACLGEVQFVEAYLGVSGSVVVVAYREEACYAVVRFLVEVVLQAGLQSSIAGDFAYHVDHQTRSVVVDSVEGCCLV